MTVSYEAYLNPSPDNIPLDMLLEVAPHAPPKPEGRDLLTHVLQQIRDSDQLSPETRKWRDEVVSWMPYEVSSWWLSGFTQDMVKMPLEWWQLYAEGIVAARCSERVVGSAAVTAVTGAERWASQSAEIRAREIRGLRSDLHGEEKVGLNVMGRAVGLAYDLSPEVPIVAMTTTFSPALAKICSQLGAVPVGEATSPAYKVDGHYLRNLMCWTRPVPQEMCGDCPRNPENNTQLWCWPRQRPDIISEMAKATRWHRAKDEYEDAT